MHDNVNSTLVVMCVRVYCVQSVSIDSKSRSELEQGLQGRKQEQSSGTVHSIQTTTVSTQLTVAHTDNECILLPSCDEFCCLHLE